MSVFFVLMKGQFDSLLSWPFRQTVKFCLIDQSQNESREDVVDSFKPDPKSTSFQRPISDFNIAIRYTTVLFTTKITFNRSSVH